MGNQNSVVGIAINLWSVRAQFPSLADARDILRNVQIGSGAHQPRLKHIYIYR